MIRLQKGGTPGVLTQHGAVWTAEFKAYRHGRAGVPQAAATRYRHPEIKEALRGETHDKCAYCESRFAHVAPGDIEHILPKAHFEDLVCDWDNLTLVCGECNRRKGDYGDAQIPLINPYADEPGAHLEAHGPLIQSKIGDVRGEATTFRIGLNRGPLLVQRAERIMKLSGLRLALEQAEPGERGVWLDQLRAEADDEAEYAFVVRDYLGRIGIQP